MALVNNERVPVIKEEIRQQFLNSSELMGKLVDISFNQEGKKLTYNGIKARFEKNSAKLVNVDVMDKIKIVLGLDPEAVIYEYVKASKK